MTVATGVCLDEEGQESSLPITITQAAVGPPYSITASGFLGEATNQLTGTLSEDGILELTGSLTESGGTTTSSYALTLEGADRMVGTETWNWVGGVGDCPGSKSSVVATRNQD